jgi:hypothetical protein
MALEEFGNCMSTQLGVEADRLIPEMTKLGEDCIRKVTAWWNALPAWLKGWLQKLAEQAQKKYMQAVLVALVGEPGAVIVGGLSAGVGLAMLMEAFEHCSSQL